MMLARTPPEIVTDRFERRALEMVDVIDSWETEIQRLLVASYIAGCLKYEYERGVEIGKAPGS